MKLIFLLVTFLNVLYVQLIVIVQEKGPTTQSNALIPCIPSQAHPLFLNVHVLSTQLYYYSPSATAPATTGITRSSTLLLLWANGSVVCAPKEATARWIS
jgi:hypothetical protein